jgi:hypothetical protein
MHFELHQIRSHKTHPQSGRIPTRPTSSENQADSPHHGTQHIATGSTAAAGLLRG